MLSTRSTPSNEITNVHGPRVNEASGVPDAEGDKAFDEEPYAAPAGAPFGGVTLVAG